MVDERPPHPKFCTAALCERYGKRPSCEGCVPPGPEREKLVRAWAGIPEPETP